MAPDLYGDLSLLLPINSTRFIRLFDFLGFYDSLKTIPSSLRQTLLCI